MPFFRLDISRVFMVIKAIEGLLDFNMIKVIRITISAMTRPQAAFFSAVWLPLAE